MDWSSARFSVIQGTFSRVDNSFGPAQTFVVSSKNVTPRPSPWKPHPQTSNGHVTPTGVLLVTVISAVALVVAVFGHPMQSIAAAVIVSALAALVGGPQVLHISAKVLEPLTRFLSSTPDTVHVSNASDRLPLMQSHEDSLTEVSCPTSPSTSD